MYLNIHQAYEDKTLNPQYLFQKPDYSHISVEIKVSDAIKISFDDIYIADDYSGGNGARENGQDPGHVDRLVQSFSKYADTTQPLGGVIKQPPGSPQKYKLLYGFGRSLAQIELGLDGWFFNVIKANPTALEDIQSFENEDQLPKRPNKERDIIQVKSRQVREGRLAKDENVIDANIRKIYPQRNKVSVDRIVSAICAETNTKQRFAYYTEAKIKLWRKDHASDYFEIEGKLHENMDEYGWTSNKGGLYRTWHRSIKKFADDGKKSYVNCFIGTIGENTSLEKERKNIIEEYIGLRLRYWKVYKKDVKFLRLNGFFPQATEDDNWKSFVLVEEDKIENEIKARIKMGVNTPSNLLDF